MCRPRSLFDLLEISNNGASPRCAAAACRAAMFFSFCDCANPECQVSGKNSSRTSSSLSGAGMKTGRSAIGEVLLEVFQRDVVRDKNLAQLSMIQARLDLWVVPVCTRVKDLEVDIFGPFRYWHDLHAGFIRDP